MATEDDSEIPETGAVFTFGKSKFADNSPNKFWIRNDKVTQIACGDEHTCLVAESGRVFTFGANDWGQLGLGHTKIATKPSCIKSLKHEKVRLAACGRSHTLVCTESGRVYGCGANGESQLGITSEDSQNVNSPQVLEKLPEVRYKVLSAGTDHSLALTEDGQLYVWGGGSEGQLGLGEHMTECATPTQLNFDERVAFAACGYYHTAVVTDSGSLYTFGETEGGKLGIGEDEDNSVPNKVDIPEKVVRVSCGGTHTVAVTDNGKVYTFGEGGNGQLGHGTMLLQQNKPSLVTSIKEYKIKYSACGENHTALISDKGLLFTFGDGRHGKLGLGEENFANQFKPSKVPRFFKFIVDEVACGGCHMLTLAHRKVENGAVASSDDDSEEEAEVPKTGLRSLDDMDLSASVSARDRRRGAKDSTISLNRTLPPLSSLGTRSLPPLNSSLQAAPSAGRGDGQVNPLDRRLPTLQHVKAQEAKQDAAKKRLEEESEEEESETDSDVSVTPDGESEDDSSQASKMTFNKTHTLKKTGDFVPLHNKKEEKPGKVDSKKKVHVKEDDDDDEEDEETESEEEEEEDNKVKSDQQKKEEAKTKKDEVKKSKESTKTGKDQKKKKGGFFGKKQIDSEEEEDEEEEEEEEDDKEMDKDKKKSKKKAGSEDEEASTETEEEDSKNKDKDKKKDKKKGKDAKEEETDDKKEDEPKKKSKTCVIL